MQRLQAVDLIEARLRNKGLRQMSGIEKLLQAIQSGALLGPNTFADLEIEEVMSGRDEPIFEEQWLVLFERVKNVALSEGDARRMDILREVAFKTAYNRCSDPDLSAYVSDDFEVIAKGIATNPEQDFLVALIENYIDGKIPHGAITRSGTSMQSLLAALS